MYHSPGALPQVRHGESVLWRTGNECRAIGAKHIPSRCDVRTVQRAAAASRKRAVLRNQKNPPVNFVTKYFTDKSRQDWCSELKRASARWFGIWRVVNRFDDSPPQLLNDAIHVIRYEILYRFNR